jgi:membrane associated rhomboid family serine protease
MSFGPPVTPQIIKNLMIANAAVFLAQVVIPPVSALGVVIPERVWLHLEIWRPFTYMWLHSVGGLPLHLLMNVFMLWMFGSELALYWGQKRFLRYYLTCGVGAGLLIATLPFLPGLTGWWSPMTEELAKSTLGASGAVMGVLLAFSFTWPERTIQLLFPPIPLRAIWLIPLVLFFEFATGSPDVSHVGHLGGLVVGWTYLVHEGKTPGIPTFKTLKLRYQRSTMARSSKAIPARRRRSLKVRYQRYRMRNKLRSVQDEERQERDRKDSDRTRR